MIKAQEIQIWNMHLHSTPEPLCISRLKPFATLHAYIRSADRDFFEKILRLTPANKANAQLCLIISDDATIYQSKEEIHGLFVVAKVQLKKDISTFGETELAQEMADVL